MDTHADDNLSDLERRLSGWQPSSDGLNPDAAIFAAGRASACSGAGRFLWPVVSTCLTLMVAALGIGLVNERAERLALAQQVRPQAPTPAPQPSPDPTTTIETPSADALPSNAYLAMRRRLEQNPDVWLAYAAPKAEPAQGPLAPNPPILQVWRRDRLLDP